MSVVLIYKNLDSMGQIMSKIQVSHVFPCLLKKQRHIPHYIGVENCLNKVSFHTIKAQSA